MLHEREYEKYVAKTMPQWLVHCLPMVRLKRSPFSALCSTQSIVLDTLDPSRDTSELVRSIVRFRRPCHRVQVAFRVRAYPQRF